MVFSSSSVTSKTIHFLLMISAAVPAPVPVPVAAPVAEPVAAVASAVDRPRRSR